MAFPLPYLLDESSNLRDLTVEDNVRNVLFSMNLPVIKLNRLTQK